MRTKTIKPPVKSNRPFTVNIVQSDHQLITVKHDGKSYTKTFTIPAGKVLNYKSYIALTDDDGYYVGRIKEAIDLASNSTTISASEARPIIHTVTVEQYQLQDINVHLTDPGNIIRFEDETTSYSFTAEDKTKYTSDCSTRLVNYDPGTSDHPGPGDIQENFTIAAETNPQRNENVQVLIYQSPHQTITVDYKGTKHTEPFIIKRRDIVSATIEAEEGYKPGLLNRTKVRATNFDNIVFKASAAGKAKKKIRIRQKRHQTITAVYKGKTFETTFEAYLGDKIQFSVEASPGWTAGVLNVDADYTVAGLEPLEVTVSDAEPVMYTVTPIQTPHQTIYIKYGDVRSSTPVRVPSGTRVEFEIVPETGYNAGTLDKLSAVVDGMNITVSATPAEIKKYNLNIVFDPEAHTTLKVTKDGTVFGTYTENTVLKFQYGTVLTFALTMEEGYTETRNPNSITMNKDNTLVIQGTSKKQFTITLTQTDNQTIYAMYKGVKKTESFVVEYGDSCTFGIETSNPVDIIVGTLSVTEFTNIKENKTVTATPATLRPANLTNFVELRYPYPDNSYTFDDVTMGKKPTHGNYLFYKTVDKLREEDFKYAENAKNIVSANGAFKNAYSLTKFPVIKLKDNIRDISYIFAGCDKLTSDELNRNLSAWKLSGDLNIREAFRDCHSLERIDMSVFRNCNITDSSSVFSTCKKLKTITNIGNLNISKADGMSYLFYECNALTQLDLSNWDTGNIQYMISTFNGCNNLTELNCSTWNTGKVYNLQLAFLNCNSLVTIPVRDWDTRSVMYMDKTFMNCTSLVNLDVSKWDTSKVVELSNTFYRCSSLKTLDVSKWKTSNVLRANSLFGGCEKLTSLDVSKWDTSNITTADNMFDACRALANLDVSKWNTSKMKTASHMFSSCTNLTSLDISKWNTSNIRVMSNMFNSCTSLTNIDVSRWNTSNAAAMGGMFAYCNALTSVDVSNWDTSNVNNLSYIFSNCSSLTTVDVSRWNTGNATNIPGMFAGCTKLTSVDVSRWNTGKVQYMNNLFAFCYLLPSIDVSGWDTSSVIDMHELFNSCKKVTSLDLSRWNTSKVTDMSAMFVYCSGLTSLKINNWDTSKVRNMRAMFKECTNLTTIDGVFDLKSCTNYEDMFDQCSSLTSIKVKNLPTDIDTFCRGARISKDKVTVVS
nr:MAG TPA: protein of unknown function DUF285 [Bacteriophage sp.]